MTTANSVGEAIAAKIFRAALYENRCDELLTALSDGGSATVDVMGNLVIISAETIQRIKTGVDQAHEGRVQDYRA